jgi:phosphoglycerate dehydrogenase-like enzyme
MQKPITTLLIGASARSTLFAPDAWAELNEIATVRYPNSEKAPSEVEAVELMSGADICVCSWGSPPLSAAVLDAAPKLQLVIYAAGSVKPIVTQEFIDRKITITNGAGVIAENVAECTLGYIIVTLKNAWRLAEETRAGRWRNTPERLKTAELYGKTIGVIGAGYVGRAVLRLLSTFNVSLLLYDPFISAEQAQKLGAQKTELDDLMRTADIVTLHAPDLPTTRHMLDQRRLRLLKDGGIIINTARGALIDEKVLIEELRTGRITACLDVTDPEPPDLSNHPFRELANVILTPHIAGGVTNGRLRLGQLVIDEIKAYLTGKPPLYPVDLTRLDTIG